MYAVSTDALAAFIVGLGLVLVLALIWREFSVNPAGLRSGSRALLVFIVLVGLGAFLYVFFLQPPEEKSIPYGGGSTSFLGYVKQGQVDRVVQQGTQLTITLTDGKTTLTSQVPSDFTNVLGDIESACAESDAKCVLGKPELTAIEPSQSGQILTLLLTALLPVVLIGAIFWFMVRQARGGQAVGPMRRRGTRERLEELEALRAKGLVTDEEYVAKRREILGDL